MFCMSARCLSVLYKYICQIVKRNENRKGADFCIQIYFNLVRKFDKNVDKSEGNFEISYSVHILLSKGIVYSDLDWKGDRNWYWTDWQGWSNQGTCRRKGRHSAATTTTDFLWKTNVSFNIISARNCFRLSNEKSQEWW